MASFNEIRKIVLDKMVELEAKVGSQTPRFETIEGSIADVQSKYEQFQELFATLISEMQTASENDNDEKASKISGSNGQLHHVKRISPEFLDDVRNKEAMSTQMS